jgi:hypothetical protein
MASISTSAVDFLTIKSSIATEIVDQTVEKTFGIVKTFLLDLQSHLKSLSSDGKHRTLDVNEKKLDINTGSISRL